MISKTADKLPQSHTTEFRGIPIILQWPTGSTRVGENSKGEPFKIEMKADYGYIPSTVDSDADDHLDVYVGPNKDSEYAYVLEQVQDGEFDEYKLMLGYDSLEDAEKSFLDHLPENMLGEIWEVPFDEVIDAYKQELPETSEEEGNIHHERVMKHVYPENKSAGDDDRKSIKDWEDEHERRKRDEEKLTVIDAFVKKYKHEVDFYEEVCRHAKEELEDALQDAGIRAIVTCRAKKPRKLKMKLVQRDPKRHYKSFREIYEDLADLAGVRVALYLPADRAAVEKIIEKEFVPVRDPKVFPRDRDDHDGMGYVATHYLVQLRPETLRPDKDELRYADTNIEIQVASVLMHAWAEVTHDLIYKPQKGPLNAEEIKMVDDLNDIVRAGEATLEKLQESVEARQNGAELRFELSAALTKLAKRLEFQSKGRAFKRITAKEVAQVAKQAAELYVRLMDFMKGLGWHFIAPNAWSQPEHPQDVVEVFYDGWIHRAWDKIEGSGSTVEELQAHLAKYGMGETIPPHESPKPQHTTYLQAKLALWKAHSAEEKPNLEMLLHRWSKASESKDAPEVQRIEAEISKHYGPDWKRRYIWD